MNILVPRQLPRGIEINPASSSWVKGASQVMRPDVADLGLFCCYLLWLSISMATTSERRSLVVNIKAISA
ncbi:hypothetical protein [Methylobacter svalbardensis]|uniref:hypothetical protein n=1 Tax=Methylobacter svalbardensis TaxID=3080016 RepID=UPI0030EB940C